MEEIKIEMDGKEVVLKMTRPTHKHTRDFKKGVMPLYKDLRKIQAQIEKEDENLDIDRFFELEDKLHKAQQGIILDLHDKSVLKTPADFDKIAEEDLQKLYGWLREKTGAARTAEQERFLSSSGSAQK